MEKIKPSRVQNSLSYPVFQEILRNARASNLDIDHLCWVMHTRKQSEQYLKARSTLMKNHALTAHALDGLIKHGEKLDKKSSVVHSHPMGKPRLTKLAKYLDTKIQEYVATLPGTTKATSLHENCLICQKFINKAGKNGKLKTTDFKLIARLHSDNTKTSLSHLKVKMSSRTVVPMEHGPIEHLDKICQNIPPIPRPAVDPFLARIAERFDTTFGEPAPAGQLNGIETFAPSKRLKVSCTSKPNHTGYSILGPTIPEALRSTGSQWTKVIGKRSSKQRRKAKLELIARLEHDCDVLDSEIMAVKRKASNPGIIDTAAVRLIALQNLPGLKNRKREIVAKLVTLRRKVSRH